MGSALRAAAFSSRRLAANPPRRPFAAAAGAPPPSSVDTVVVGGGIVGASAAWQLAKHGHSVVVLEQNTLTSGTTWHAAGLIGNIKGHEAMVSLVEWTRKFYTETVDKETGLSDVGWAQTGSFGLARTAEMWTQLQRATTLLEEYGIRYTLFGPGAPLPLSAAKSIHPLLDLEGEGIVGAVHTPDDGIVNPSDACMHVVRLAREAGVRFIEHCGVAELETSTLADGTLSVTGVKTVHGDAIECETALLACGQWTRQLAATVGVNVPVAIVPHQYTIFERMEDPDGKVLVDNTLPVVRDYERKVYIKPEVGGLMVGMFEGPHCEMPPEVANRNSGAVAVPAGASHELYNGTTDKMEDGLYAAMALVPQLAECGIKQMVHGPDTHSVDHEPILGRAPSTDNLWIATGFNSLGIQTGPAVGLALAEWMTTGEPGNTLKADFAELDVRRFHPTHTADHNWCTSRALEGYGVHWSSRRMRLDEGCGFLRCTSASLQRVRPSYKCAVFGAVGPSGFERPLHFGGGSGQAGHPFYTHEELAFDARDAGWWGNVEAEHEAAREGVALFDLSSFGKLHVSGAGAEAAMEWCSSSEVSNAAAGKIIYTQMLNERGGVESDLTILPLEQDETGVGREFYVVTSSATCTRDADNIARASRLKGIADVSIEEITDDWAVLALMGPQSRGLMEAVFPTVDFGNDKFPFGTAQELAADAGVATGVRALRVSFVGELGWEMHCPAPQAGALFQVLHEAGTKAGANDGIGLVNAGYRALLMSLRLEKKFVHFGHDLSPTDSVLEAGLGFVSVGKLKVGTDFVGREALVAQKARGFQRRLVSFMALEDGVSLWGGEAIYRDGIRVGKLTSGGIGHTVNGGNAIGIGYVAPPEAAEGLGLKDLKAQVLSGEYELGVVGTETRVKAEVVWDALYDPRSDKMRDV